MAGGGDGRHLPAGIYERVVTKGLAERLASLADVGLTPSYEDLDDAELPAAVARHVAEVVRSALTTTGDAESRIRLLEQVVDVLATATDHDGDPHLETPPQVLRAVQPIKEGPGRLRLVPPVLGVGQSDLLVNARGEPSLMHSLLSEIRSADRIDLVVAFIKRSGLRPLLDALGTAAQRGVQIRVLTTTYLGGTDQRALDDLVAIGAQVKVSYDLGTTRLHAKGWLFERNSGFHTAYIGSSNLSHAAMTQGQEWNVRLAHAQTPDLVEKFRAAFAAYWNDPALGFEAYDPTDSFIEDKLKKALLQARGGTPPDPDDVLSPFRIQPMPHQRIMLEDLTREREVYGRHRNLVVAATGTGKTAVAAFDYERFARSSPAGLPSLLFVAHRREILQQSRRMFRHVLRSGDFGELLVGGDKPQEWRHVFASIQSLSSSTVSSFAPDAFDMVVVDEFHHAAAPSYQALLDRVRPRVLLGLTATPERADGQDVTAWFDGHIASELRLWDALEQHLLSPFHYYGVGHEALDFRGKRWEGGHYLAEDLDNVLTGNHVVMNWVIEQVHDKVTDPRRMRALAFASTVNHAHFAAQRFRLAGINAIALDGTTPRDERDAALAGLHSGAVQVIVTVDLFNEGVDVPSVDTVLLMRPTESVTVFLQQLGRGLRRDEGKDVLTVLDFIGYQHKRFRFDLRYRALTGVTRQELVKAVESGFPYLPSGTFITLDRVAQDAVLENVRAHIPSTAKALIDDVRSHAQARGVTRYPLRVYLEDAVAELGDIYRRKDSSWTSVCRAAGLNAPPSPLGRESEEEKLLRRVRGLTHVDDLPRLDAYERLLRAQPGDLWTEHDRMFATMLFFAIWPSGKGFDPLAGLAPLAEFPSVVEELLQVWAVCRERISHATYAMDGAPLSSSPLRVHARYTREEMLAGIGWATLGDTPRSPGSQIQGTRQTAMLKADVFNVTWQKSEKVYSPSTMYRDYAISAQDIHWESPNHLRYEAETTRRYVEHRSRGRHVLIFARESVETTMGTQPYLFLGPADYVSHEGSRPVSFRWRLHRPMPTDFYESARVVAG